jgi:ATP sulfurylase
VGAPHGRLNTYTDRRPDLFESLDDLGITPIFFEPHGYNAEIQDYDLLSRPGTVAISGTEVRHALVDGGALPDWCVRDAVQAMLRDSIAADRPVFWEPEVAAATVR